MDHIILTIANLLLITLCLLILREKSKLSSQLTENLIQTKLFDETLLANLKNVSEHEAIKIINTTYRVGVLNSKKIYHSLVDERKNC